MSVEKAQLQNQTRTESNQAKAFLCCKQTLFISDCFFQENLTQARNSTILNWSTNGLLQSSWLSILPWSLHTWPQHCTCLQEAAGICLAEAWWWANNRNAEGYGNMRSLLSAATHSPVSITKKKAKLATQSWPSHWCHSSPKQLSQAVSWLHQSEGTRLSQKANAPTASLCQTITIWHQENWFPHLTEWKINPKMWDRFSLN